MPSRMYIQWEMHIEGTNKSKHMNDQSQRQVQTKKVPGYSAINALMSVGQRDGYCP